MLAGHTCTPSTTQRYLQDRKAALRSWLRRSTSRLISTTVSRSSFFAHCSDTFHNLKQFGLESLGMDVERCSSPSLGPSSIEVSWGSKRSPPSVIGADLGMNGDLISKSELKVDSEVHGDIRGTGVVIGESAHITGGIIAQEIIIRGQVMSPVRNMMVTLPVNGSRERRHLPSRVCHIFPSAKSWRLATSGFRTSISLKPACARLAARRAPSVLVHDSAVRADPLLFRSHGGLFSKLIAQRRILAAARQHERAREPLLGGV
jgi:Polymer-forming cytoskeletal